MADRDGAQEEIKEAVADFTGRAKDTMNALFGKDEEDHEARKEPERTHQNPAERAAPARHVKHTADTEAPEQSQR